MARKGRASPHMVEVKMKMKMMVVVQAVDVDIDMDMDVGASVHCFLENYPHQNLVRVNTGGV